MKLRFLETGYDAVATRPVRIRNDDDAYTVRFPDVRVGIRRRAKGFLTGRVAEPLVQFTQLQSPSYHEIYRSTVCLERAVYEIVGRFQ